MLPKLQDKFPDINKFDCGHKMNKYTKITVGSLSTAIFGALFGWVIFPVILKSQISKEMSLAKGTDMREMWRKVPFALDFNVYVFNCTNPEEIVKGGKPRVQEIGPYYYEEWKEKVNLEDLEDEDAIYYNRKDTFLFKKEKSGPGLTGDEIVTVPHPIIVATAILVAIEKPTMLNMVGKAIEAIYQNPETFFVKTKVSDLLFDGIVVKCDYTDFAPKAVCTAMKKNKNLIPDGSNIKFSLFGSRNATVESAKFKVLRGIKNIMDVGKVVEFDGKTTQTIWGGPECNDFNGTDATIFPPFLTEKDLLLSYSPEICRSLGAWYEKKSSYGGIAANRYVTNLGDLPNEPNLQCFCETPSTCPKKGLMDVRKCLHAPFVASMPHFLDTDPSVQDGVVGLSPNLEKHGITIDFEPMSGTPLQAKKRLQFNMQLMKIDKLELFKGTRDDQLVPFIWIEEGLALNKTFIKMLDNQLFLVIRIVTVIKWLAFIGGIFGTVGGLFMRNKAKILKFTISPESQRQTTNGHALNGTSNQQKLNISTIQATLNNDKI